LSGRLPSQPFCHRGRKVRGESPSYKNRLFVGAALAATLCVIENRGLGVAEAIFTATLAPSKAESSGRKPLLQKPSFRRSGFRRDPCVIENRGLGVAEAIFTATLAPSKAESSGRKPFLQKPSFRRSGFSRDPLRHRGPEVRVCRGGFRRDPFAIEDGKFGAKAPLYKNRLFVGAALAATLCVIENRRFGLVGVASVATLAPFKAEG
jgi:hypothetical protein